MYLKVVTFITLILIESLSYQGVVAITIKREDSGRQIEIAIAKLWSSSESERESAKRTLLNKGKRSSKPLLVLLEDITDNHGKKRYAVGKEKTEEYEITWRLENDVVELLGKLHSVEAIPILIKLFWSRPEITSLGMYPYMQALVSIGSSAVPKLIEVLNDAQSIAVKAVERENLDNDKQQQWIDYKTYRIQAKAILVLGEIGDRQAMPILSRLRSTTKNEDLLFFIDQSLKQIEERNKL